MTKETVTQFSLIDLLTTTNKSMEAELIQALSNANINSDSAEIIASEYISYLYFSEVISGVSDTILGFSLIYGFYSLLKPFLLAAISN